MQKDRYFFAAVKIQALWRGVRTRLLFVWKLREKYEQIARSIDGKFAFPSFETSAIRTFWDERCEEVDSLDGWERRLLSPASRVSGPAYP